MTKPQLDAIKSRLQAALPKSDGMRDRLVMTHTPETENTDAAVWYDDGDLCAIVHGNLGLDIDGNAMADFFSHALSDVDDLLTEIESLKKVVLETTKEEIRALLEP